MNISLEQLLSIALLVPMDDPRDVDCRWGAPVCLWGSPGIGKSRRVETAGEILGIPVETLYLSTHQPEDISGVPMIDPKTGSVSMMCTLPQVHVLVAAKRGILFLDELSTARPAVQGAGLAVVYERVFAGRRLPGRVRVVAAANPPEEAAGGWQLSPPMSNRFMHMQVPVPSTTEWISWLLQGGNENMDPIEAGENAIAERWGDVYPKIKGLAAGFHKKTGGKLYNMPKPGDQARSRAWASPRSWEMALRTIAACEILGKAEHATDMMAACLGPGVATEWAAWVKEANLPDPEDILTHGWTPNRQRLDICMAAYSSAIGFALDKKDKSEQRKWAIQAWKLLNVAAENKLADLALAPAAALMRAGYTTKAGPDVSAVARDLIARFGATGMSAFVQKKP